MTDVVTPGTRSKMMAGIRGKDTRPEIIIRKELFRQGFRYRLHEKKLAGKPDIVLPRYRAAVFVHGCFWHGHTCNLFRLPSTRTDFWKTKIDRNRHNDERAISILLKSEWRVAIVWECALKGRGKWELLTLTDAITKWIRSDVPELEIRGCQP
ncbi:MULTISPECIES: very short patch repair endonuclease [Pusillimonas]|uniref:Very short patch repair endonuclease n=1 Tax=Pusillimonas minor TaxID=2697024 RepID=A0A842HSH8_9BURK|nr:MULTISPECIES: DNA mismatch endonuclease Vsr [Pusillimonas]MBC2771116.1 DNA mismatch endonuclease Vsr [Pusillimonas minor]ROT46742.1 very short patch repair endonuclease [Pusillimonas sp. NJUB218]